MARATATSRTETRLPPNELQAAFDTAIDFPVERADTLRLASDILVEQANKEIAFGRIILDDEGLTTGVRLHIIEPARALLGQWRQVRRQFDVAIEPQMRSIRALQEVAADEAKTRQRAARDEQDIEARLEADQRYIRIRNELRTADERYQRHKTEHENREANMGAHNPLYWLAMLGIGVAEWLINYDVFFLFAGVVAIAVGATIVMGVLLAFAAHGHGLLFKQWSYRFGEHRASIDRFGDWRMLALSTFSLLIVLIAAAGSRYAAVMHQMAGQPAINILGADAQVTVDPMRDVLLSLLWNVMAWAVGVFIAYMAHDKDPDFMSATLQYQRANRRYDRYRRPYVAKLQQIKAKLGKDIEKLEAKARTRFADVAVERELLDQIDAHEAALVDAITVVVRGNAQTYLANLAQLVAAQLGAVTIERTGARAGQISIEEFRQERMVITPAMIHGLV